MIWWTLNYKSPTEVGRSMLIRGAREQRVLNLEFQGPHYSDPPHESDWELGGHWDSVGKNAGGRAKREEALAEFGQHLDPVPDFDLHAYLVLNRDVA
jgi:hypothetical protein